MKKFTLCNRMHSLSYLKLRENWKCFPFSTFINVEPNRKFNLQYIHANGTFYYVFIIPLKIFNILRGEYTIIIEFIICTLYIPYIWIDLYMKMEKQRLAEIWFYAPWKYCLFSILTDGRSTYICISYSVCQYKY